MKKIYLASSQTDANLICTELRSMGFEAIVQDDMSAIPTAVFPSIWVPDDEADRAVIACAELTSGNGPGPGPAAA